MLDFNPETLKELEESDPAQWLSLVSSAEILQGMPLFQFLIREAVAIELNNMLDYKTTKDQTMAFKFSINALNNLRGRLSEYVELHKIHQEHGRQSGVGEYLNKIKE